MSTDPRIEELDNLITSVIKDVGLGPAYASRLRRILGNAYFMVPRADLPKTDVVERDGIERVNVGISCGSWPITADLDKLRQHGLEYLAAAEAITAYQASAKAAEAEGAKKLDAEADQLRLAAYEPGPALAWESLSESLRDKYRRTARKARELHKAPQ